SAGAENRVGAEAAEVKEGLQEAGGEPEEEVNRGLRGYVATELAGLDGGVGHAHASHPGHGAALDAGPAADVEQFERPALRSAPLAHARYDGDRRADMPARAA